MHFAHIKMGVRALEERFLLARLQHKDEKAPAQLIDQYAGYGWPPCARRGAGVLAEADLEEAAADTFVKLWSAAASVRPEKGGLKAYLGAIARNEARSRVRRARPVLPLEEDFLLPADQQASRRWKEQEQAALVRQALEMLEPATKRGFSALLLPKAENGANCRGNEMNASTVRSRLARGRAALRKALQERGISHEDVV